MRFLIHGPEQWLLRYEYADEDNEHPNIIGVFSKEDEARATAQSYFSGKLIWSDDLNPQFKGIGFAHADIPEDARDPEDPRYVSVVLERVRTFPGGYKDECETS